MNFKSGVQQVGPNLLERRMKLTINGPQKHRFHVGDSLYFKYMNDSVLVVDEDDYNRCGSTKPIAKYEDGKTVIELDRYGFFFFVSGVGGHCKSGQKLIVWVMAHHPISQVPASAPSAGGGGSGSGSGLWPWRATFFFFFLLL
ncbi:early nodulin-like protein 2 [Cinnamomum micranthum f. kanehirae]|uniref:Early nodulin-like protein 2 n=1 Tax=Cinnamomum micranthum f. kanehirae TaxID=337451 RepID=A0A3S3N8Z8_9MAGN|nr:early nodulin-like protein 2 [Cinnamomum micranthum f. kanehirae]